MFKFVVLCAFVAAATADPAAVIGPVTYSSNVVLPSPAVYSSPSSLVYPSPLVSSLPVAYSGYGYPHLIKKRALAVSSYIAPSPYVASTPLVSSYAGHVAAAYGAPIAPLATTYSSALYPAAHLIKKRAVPLVLPSPYVAPAHYPVAPLVASPYAAGAVLSSPYLSAGPLAYTQLIKK